MMDTLALAVPRADLVLRVLAVGEEGAATKKPQQGASQAVVAATKSRCHTLLPALVRCAQGTAMAGTAENHQHLRSTVGCWGSLRSYSGKVTGTLAVRQIRRPQ